MAPATQRCIAPKHSRFILSNNDTAATGNETFTDLGVIPDIANALAISGITQPFPIQELTIPIALGGTDLIGQARTGTGKTLAFGIILLQRITCPGDPEYPDFKFAGKPQALVICPTRELAIQVAKDLKAASIIRKVRILTIYGGVPYDSQLDQLSNGVDVVVGTPGRLLDLVNRHALDLSQLKVAVLDEADEMLDLGFLPDVERLLGQTPGDRQTLLFSATMPAAIMALARSALNHPVNIRAEGQDAQATVPDITQYVYQTHILDKPEIVARILQANGTERVMIFSRTKRTAQRLTNDLAERGFKVTSIHGDLKQGAREKALTQFRTGQVSALVATDVAARGIDVAGISHVINYECPDSELTYVHRIGRTGRAGAAGISVTLIDWADLARWKMIDNLLNLNLDEPKETYSTSAHLYTDLDIEPGTVGRIAKKAVSDAQTTKTSTTRSKQHSRRKNHAGQATEPKQIHANPAGSTATNDSHPSKKTRKPRRRIRQGQVLDLPTESKN